MAGSQRSVEERNDKRRNQIDDPLEDWLRYRIGCRKFIRKSSNGVDNVIGGQWWKGPKCHVGSRTTKYRWRWAACAGLTTFTVDSLDRLTSKTLISLLKLCFYVAYKLRYMCLRSSSGLASAILNFYFRSARTVFLMCHMDTIFSKTFPTMYYKLYYSTSKAKI